MVSYTTFTSVISHDQSLSGSLVSSEILSLKDLTYQHVCAVRCTHGVRLNGSSTDTASELPQPVFHGGRNVLKGSCY